MWREEGGEREGGRERKKERERERESPYLDDNGVKYCTRNSECIVLYSRVPEVSFLIMAISMCFIFIRTSKK